MPKRKKEATPDKQIVQVPVQATKVAKIEQSSTMYPGLPPFSALKKKAKTVENNDAQKYATTSSEAKVEEDVTETPSNQNNTAATSSNFVPDWSLVAFDQKLREELIGFLSTLRGGMVNGVYVSQLERQNLIKIFRIADLQDPIPALRSLNLSTEEILRMPPYWKDKYEAFQLQTPHLPIGSTMFGAIAGEESKQDGHASFQPELGFDARHATFGNIPNSCTRPAPHHPSPQFGNQYRNNHQFTDFGQLSRARPSLGVTPRGLDPFRTPGASLSSPFWNNKSEDVRLLQDALATTTNKDSTAGTVTSIASERRLLFQTPFSGPSIGPPGTATTSTNVEIAAFPPPPNSSNSPSSFYTAQQSNNSNSPSNFFASP